MKRIFTFIIFILVLFIGLLVWQGIRFSDQKLHVIFCDVGQGDGILIITPSDKQILIDGGSDDSILACLSNHMPFWDRNIELMVLSHPHADHLNGLIEVLDGYTVDHFATEALANDTVGYKELTKKISAKGGLSPASPAGGFGRKELDEGDRIQIEKNVTIEVLGPSKAFLDETSPKGKIGESSEFASLVSVLSYGDFDVIFTGDSQVSGMKEALDFDLKGDTFSFEVLQVPHHGSRFGLDKQLVQQIDPKLAVISVGKNKYGHPTPFILSLLKNEGIQYRRTDEDGDVEIISDGKKFWLKY